MITGEPGAGPAGVGAGVGATDGAGVAAIWVTGAGVAVATGTAAVLLPGVELAEGVPITREEPL